LRHERNANTDLTKAKVALEQIVNEQRLRLVSHEADNIVDGAKQRALNDQASSSNALSGLVNQMQTDIAKHQEMAKTAKKLERTVTDLQSQVVQQETMRQRAEDATKRLDDQVRQQRDYIDELEAKE
ncbi:hypothetical protein GQ42DRAFT_112477, partial [Ramicandelaber brevisporus]